MGSYLIHLTNCNDEIELWRSLSHPKRNLLEIELGREPFAGKVHTYIKHTSAGTEDIFWQRAGSNCKPPQARSMVHLPQVMVINYMYLHVYTFELLNDWPSIAGAGIEPVSECRPIVNTNMISQTSQVLRVMHVKFWIVAQEELSPLQLSRKPLQRDVHQDPTFRIGENKLSDDNGLIRKSSLSLIGLEGFLMGLAATLL
ncbi:uncharacterized protein H6S33_012032 [Morchella sextelata]|uniref:uncharacterized protein n=1 Tax=Morchella sextelata TaxID=1174677 RepID=UPI001D04F393|nr:uncharacterized protein H6S33_012032 [Morchella sextelata]KAH0610505.1 hypothetical protein H6S33_012032 [Morchella sextelata]